MYILSIDIRLSHYTSSLLRPASLTEPLFITMIITLPKVLRLLVKMTRQNTILMNRYIMEVTEVILPSSTFQQTYIAEDVMKKKIPGRALKIAKVTMYARRATIEETIVSFTRRLRYPLLGFLKTRKQKQSFRGSWALNSRPISILFLSIVFSQNKSCQNNIFSFCMSFLWVFKEILLVKNLLLRESLLLQESLRGIKFNLSWLLDEFGLLLLIRLGLFSTSK